MSTAGDPVIERIAQNILDTLKGISQLAGYQNDADAERELGERNRMRDRLLVLRTGDASLSDEAPAGHIAWDQVFIVVGFIQETRDSTQSNDERLHSLITDVHRALTVDRTRGSLAVDTKPLGFDVRHEEMFSRFDMTFEVNYRTLEDDPFTQ